MFSRRGIGLNQLNRRQVTILLFIIPAVLALLLVGCGARGGSQAGSNGEEKSYTVRVSTINTPESTFGRAAQHFKETLEEKTNGRMKVEIFFSGELYGQNEEIQAVQSGAVEMSLPTSPIVANEAPEYSVFVLPYVFEDYDTVPETLSKDSPLGKVFYENEDLAERNIKVVGAAFSGFMTLISDKEIRQPSDVQGMKIRIQASDVMRDTIEAFGGTPAPLAYGEVYTALQQGVVDGVDTNIISMYAGKFYEVANGLTDTRHNFSIGPIIMSADFFNSLPKDLQRAVLEAGEETTTRNLKLTEQVENDLRKELQQMEDFEVRELTPEQRQVFKDAVVPEVWNQYADVVGQDIIDELRSQQD